MRSRIWSKATFASCVSYFDSGCYYYGGPWEIGPTVHTKTYIFTHFAINMWSYLLWSPVLPTGFIWSHAGSRIQGVGASISWK